MSCFTLLFIADNLLNLTLPVSTWSSNSIKILRSHIYCVYSGCICSQECRQEFFRDRETNIVQGLVWLYLCTNIFYYSVNYMSAQSFISRKVSDRSCRSLWIRYPWKWPLLPATKLVNRFQWCCASLGRGSVVTTLWFRWLRYLIFHAR